MFPRSFNAQVGLENDCSICVTQFFSATIFLVRSLLSFCWPALLLCLQSLTSCFLIDEALPTDTPYLTTAALALKSPCLTSWDTAFRFVSWPSVVVVSLRCWWWSPVLLHLLCQCSAAQVLSPALRAQCLLLWLDFFVYFSSPYL